MSLLKRIQLDIMTEAAALLGRGVAGLSDEAMLRGLRGLRRLALDPSARAGIDELIEALESGPPNTDTLRRMLRESRKDEIRDFIEGNFFFEEMDFENLE